MSIQMHEETLLKVLVFKTDIRQDQDVIKVSEVFDNHRSIMRWTIDRNDIDNVLRIETDCLNADDVIDAVQDAGFNCEELPD